MTVNIANTANNNTFDYWRNRTNELAFAMSTYAVTANSSNAAVGNAAITGNFSANSLVINNGTVNSYITVGNSTINVFVNSSYISIGNSTVNSQSNSTYHKTQNFLAGANVVVNTTSVFLTGLVGGFYSNVSLDKQKLYISGNATATVSVNSSMIDMINSSSELQLSASQILTGTSVINSTAITTGAGGFTANTSAIKIGSNVVSNTSSLNIVSTGFSYLANSTSTNLNSTYDNLFVNSSLIKISNTAGVTANLTNDYLVIGNSTVNSTIITTGTGGLIANTSAAKIGSNLIANTSTLYISNGVVNTTVNASTIFIGNGTVNSISNSTIIRLANSTTTANLTSDNLTIGTSLVNSTIITTGTGGLIANTTAIKVGSNVVANTTTVFIGNTTVNSTYTSTLVQVANSSGTANLTPISLTIGSSLVDSTIITTGTGGLIANTTAIKVGSNVVANTTTVFIGNTTVNSYQNSAAFVAVGNSSTLPTVSLTTGGVTAGNNSSTGAPSFSVANSSGNTNINPISISTSWGLSTNSTQTVIPGKTTLTINTASINMGTTAANVVVTNSAFVAQNSTYTTTVNAAGFYTNGSLTVGGNSQMSGNWANVSGDLFVRGNLTVNGSLSYTGTALSDIIPTSNSFNLGNTTNRFTLWGIQANLVNDIWVGGTAYVNTSVVVRAANPSINTTITPISLNVNNYLIANSIGVYGSALVNATSFTVGTSTIANATGVYTGIVNASSHTVGTNFTANSTLVNAAAINIVGQVNTATLYSTTSANIASAVQANATGLWTTGTVNGSILSVGSSLIGNSLGIYHTGTINAVSHTTGATGTGTGGISANVTTLFIGNNTINTTITSAGLTVNGATIANNTGVYTGIVNASSHTVGTNFIANSTAIVGTGYANVTTSVNSALLTVGSSFIANTTGAYHAGTINAASHTVGSNLVANSAGITHNGYANLTTLWVGDGSKNFTANSTSIKVANTTSNITIVVPTITQRADSNTFLRADGSWAALPSAFISNGVYTTTGTATQTIDYYQMSSYNAAEYFIHVNDQSTVSSNARYIAKLLTTHDRTSGYISEFGSIYSNTLNTVGVFSITTNTSHAILQFTPNALITNTSIRYARTVV